MLVLGDPVTYAGHEKKEKKKDQQEITQERVKFIRKVYFLLSI